MKSIKGLSAVLLLLAFFSAVQLKLPAAYLTRVPVTVTQPDGQVLNLFATGDEYYNWLHDQNGFTIIRDPKNGYLVYALKVDGGLVPSTLLPGKGVDPGVFGFERHALDDPGLRPAPGDIFPSPAEVVNAPHAGTLNNIVIFIRFGDESEFTDNISSYDALFNTTTAGANSMRNYFYEVSYNALAIPSTFYPTPGATVISYQDTQPRRYYQPYDATTNPSGYTSDSDRTAREHNLLKKAVNHVNGLGQFPPGSSVDNDGDGYVDNVCFIISGAPGAWSSLLWPHRWSLYSVEAYIDGKRVYDYNFQLQTATLSWGVGVLGHEMFHSLGSPDLYHYTSNGIAPVGGWDLMEDSNDPPQHMLMHMKWKYGGWVAAVPQITASGTYTLNPSTSATNNCYRIASPSSGTQYFMAEYRKRDGTFESTIPAEGLIVYRINTAAVGNASGPPDEVYIYRPNGTNTVNGAVNQANFSSDSGRTAIDDSTNPSSFLADGSAGGLAISNVTAVGATISFTVTMPSITVTSPNGGESWSVNSGHDITWSSSGSIANVNIDYSTDNGCNWKSIATGADNDGSYTWTVPNTPSTICLVRVEGASGSPSDTSEAVFTIAPLAQPLVVTSPASGALWERGRTYAISWLKQGVQNANVRIQLFKGTSRLVKTLTNKTANDGSFDWRVPTALAVGNAYFVRVKTIDNLISDDSDTFSVIIPTLTVTAPAAGIVWAKNTTKTITWARQGTQNANVKIQLFKGTTLVSPIAATTPNDGSCDWTIPSGLPASSKYRIHIITLDRKVKGKSAAFTIAGNAG